MSFETSESTESPTADYDLDGGIFCSPVYVEEHAGGLSQSLTNSFRLRLVEAECGLTCEIYLLNHAPLGEFTLRNDIAAMDC